MLSAGCDGIVSSGVLSFAISCLGVGLCEFLVVLDRMGPGFAFSLALRSASFAACALALGGGALALVFGSAWSRVDQQELAGGVLFGIDPSRLLCTVDGATVVCEWEHVDIHETSLGFIFRMPWRAFHLLPRAAISPEQAARLEPLLDNARRKRAAWRKLQR